MAVEVIESTPDYYGEDIYVGDMIACISTGIKKARVEEILRRSIVSTYDGTITIKNELIIRLLIKGDTFSPTISKQKDSTSVVKI